MRAAELGLERSCARKRVPHLDPYEDSIPVVVVEQVCVLFFFVLFFFLFFVFFFFFFFFFFLFCFFFLPSLDSSPQ